MEERCVGAALMNVPSASACRRSSFASAAVRVALNFRSLKATRNVDVLLGASHLTASSVMKPTCSEKTPPPGSIGASR